MKNLTITFTLLGLLASGCGGGSFTGIRQVSGNIYAVTRVRPGFFAATKGDLLRCEAQGNRMNCVQLAEP